MHKDRELSEVLNYLKCEFNLVRLYCHHFKSILKQKSQLGHEQSEAGFPKLEM